METIPQVGPIRDMPIEKVIAAARLVQQGKMYSLSVSRFPGMPLFPGHPPFQVLTYRSPHGIKSNRGKTMGTSK